MKIIFIFLMTFMVSFFAGASVKLYPQNPKFPTMKLIDVQKLVPAVASTNNVISGANGATSASPVVVTSFAAQPDLARNLVVTPGGTTADVAAGDVVITGIDAKGKVISESFTFTANQSTAVVGNKAFAQVSSITFPGEDSPFGATWSVGQGDKIGISKCMDGAGWVMKGLVDGVVLTGITVATHVSDISQNTFIPNPAANGSRVFDVLYVQNYRCD